MPDQFLDGNIHFVRFEIDTDSGTENKYVALIPCEKLTDELREAILNAM